MKRRRILLLEPNYHNKYPPMGLMKIAMYHRLQGDDVVFFKGEFSDFIISELVFDLLKKLNEINIQTGIKDFNWKEHIPEIKKYIRSGKVEPDSIFENILNEQPLAELLLNSYYDIFRNDGYYAKPHWDIVYVTTLFTFYWDITIQTIEFAKRLCKDVRIGGVMASVVPKAVEKATGIKPHVGCLNISKYKGDKELPSPYKKTIIDNLPLDYSILEEIDYRYPATDAYYGYTTRGCINKCPFCAVPILEPKYKNYIPLKERINATIERFGEQRHLLLLDNNVFASDKFGDIIDEICELGFAKDAKYIPPAPLRIAIQQLEDGWNDRAYIRLAVRILNEFVSKLKGDAYTRIYSLLLNNGLLHDYTATKDSILDVYKEIKSDYEKTLFKKPIVRYVDFNQGMDARLATPERISKLAKINIRPLRIAFDNWATRKHYVNAIKLASEYGIRHMSNYLLYNFRDKPEDLYNRLLLNIDLCDALNVNIYSFPMKYHPIMDEKWFTNRDYIAVPHWNRKAIRTVQAILNSTHGKIGKGRTFFFKAFGKNESEFLELIRMPEAFIIKRWDAELNGLTQKWRNAYLKLSDEEKRFADDIISTNNFNKEKWKAQSKNVRFLLDFYLKEREDIPLANEEKKKIAIQNFEATCPVEPSTECMNLLKIYSKR